MVSVFTAHQLYCGCKSRTPSLCHTLCNYVDRTTFSRMKWSLTDAARFNSFPNGKCNIQNCSVICRWYSVAASAKCAILCRSYCQITNEKSLIIFRNFDSLRYRGIDDSEWLETNISEYTAHSFASRGWNKPIPAAVRLSLIPTESIESMWSVYIGDSNERRPRRC